MRLAEPIDPRDGYATRLIGVSDSSSWPSRARTDTARDQAEATLRLTAHKAADGRVKTGGVIAAASEEVTQMTQCSQQSGFVFDSDSPPEEERWALATSCRE